MNNPSISLSVRKLRALYKGTTDDPDRSFGDVISFYPGKPGSNKAIAAVTNGQFILVVNLTMSPSPSRPFSIPASVVRNIHQGDSKTVDVTTTDDGVRISGHGLDSFQTDSDHDWKRLPGLKVVEETLSKPAPQPYKGSYYDGLNSVLLKRIADILDALYDPESGYYPLKLTIYRATPGTWVIRDAEGEKFFALVQPLRTGEPVSEKPWDWFHVWTPPPPPPPEPAPLWNVIRRPDITPVFAP